MDSIETWEEFVKFWTTPIEDKTPEYPKYTYPTNLIGGCDLNYSNRHGLSISFDGRQSEECEDCEIYIIEDWGQGDVRQYCQRCFDDRDLEHYRNGDYTESESEILHNEKKEFIKFFRNWHFGIISDDQISECNDTVWTDKQVLEIFSILQLYVQMDDAVAQKFDENMTVWTQFVEEVKKRLS